MIRRAVIAGALAVGIAVAPMAQATPPTTPTSPTTGSDVYYRNCAAACAAGAAPIRVGQPGYRAGLDRDGDGIACEICH